MSHALHSTVVCPRYRRISRVDPKAATERDSFSQSEGLPPWLGLGEGVQALFPTLPGRRPRLTLPRSRLSEKLD